METRLHGKEKTKPKGRGDYMKSGKWTYTDRRQKRRRDSYGKEIIGRGSYTKREKT